MDAFDRLALRSALSRAVQQIRDLENVRDSQARFFQILGNIQQKFDSINT